MVSNYEIENSENIKLGKKRERYLKSLNVNNDNQAIQSEKEVLVWIQFIENESRVFGKDKIFVISILEKCKSFLVF